MKKKELRKRIKKLNKENDILQDFVLNQGLEIISKDDEIDKQNIEIVYLLDKIHDLKEKIQQLENENNNFKNKDIMYLNYLKATNEKLKIKKIYKRGFADQNNKIKTLMEIIDSEKGLRQKIKDLVDQSYADSNKSKPLDLLATLRLSLAKLIE